MKTALIKSPVLDRPATTKVERGGLAVIDYLRALAAMGVVVFHARVAMWVGWRTIHEAPQDFSALARAAAWLALPAPGLGSLVMLFFVVSGFCVHLPYARPGAIVGWKAYGARRILRILPPYLAAALASLGLIAWLVPAASADVSWAAVLTMTQNYSRGLHEFISGAQPATNPALWSLPVEAELYLTYPLLRVLVRRWGWRGALMITGGISLAATFAYHAAGWWMLAGNFAAYWVIWNAGAWLAERWVNHDLVAPPRWFAGLALIALVASGGLALRGETGGAMNLASGLGYFWLTWWLVARGELARVRVSWLDRALRRLGEQSYSLYLVHFPVLLIFAVGWGRWFGGKPANFVVTLAAAAAVWPAAWLFYRLVERPSHAAARTLGRSWTP